ncbi:response regulator [Alterisphingorhabdus coralli]|uniref:Response regulator n=1 Tax=Alterisphingorhabdus coralli TaxID=3071408 RepID=A0AA97F6Q2_9SPHN|nr:response regulator [Parasphingorhabdus sp. SCSIO 66989]WOE74466.1 response regulator [Parasphingorhabdus sp. SCSIO 66989]
MTMVETRKNFLIAEDESMIAMMLEDIIETLGHDVAAVVDSCSAAMQVLEQGHVNAAILDLNLSDGESWPLVQQLQQRGIPFLVASGDNAATPPDGVKPVQKLAKPFSLTSLEEALSTLDG